MFTGTYTAIVTPFAGDQVDLPALTKLIKLQIRGGVQGIVPVGTTGESPTLDFAEHIRVIEHSVEVAGGKIRVIAGTGGNATKEAIFLTQAAEKAGADASLQVAPYYNKPTPEGLYQHFRAIAKASKLPLILYSVPSRCQIEITIPVIQRLLRDCPNVVGIKEAGGTPDRVSQLRQAFGKDFVILSGDDSMTLPFMAVGADGVISVASNVIPKQVSRMVAEFSRGNIRAARKLHDRYYQVFKDLFVETNPGPIKAALAMLGLIREEYRLPLARMAGPNRELLEKTLRQSGILK